MMLTEARKTPPSRPLRVAYLTAGAAGMFCGSCMHDNTLAAALTQLGVDVQLIPTYTPIRTDEHDVSVDRVFFGGVNVYLQQRFPLFRHLPAVLDRIFDQPRFLRWITSRGLEINPEELGALTVSMLKGEHGHQRKEVRRLCRWLQNNVDPNVVVLTNVLIAGCVPELKRRLRVPVWVTLQGDDVFLEFLPEPFKAQAFTEIRRLIAEVDGFLVHTRYYAEFMQQYLGIPEDRIRIVRLGIETRGFAEAAVDRVAGGEAIGYLARLAPEKGLHLLVEAFIRLRNDPRFAHIRLEIAGWLGNDHRSFAEEQFAKLKSAGLEAAYRYHGVIDRRAKLAFLRGLDVFTVPAPYRDPKGLYVLEAMAAGVPVVQPNHGAFPELLAEGGGRLVTPNDPDALASVLAELLENNQERIALGREAKNSIMKSRTAPQMARATIEAILGEKPVHENLTPPADFS